MKLGFWGVIKRSGDLLNIFGWLYKVLGFSVLPVLWCGVYFLLNIKNLTAQGRTVIDSNGNFLIGITNCRRVSTPQFSADFRQRAVGFLSDEIHRYLPG